LIIPVHTSPKNFTDFTLSAIYPFSQLFSSLAKEFLHLVSKRRSISPSSTLQLKKTKQIQKSFQESKHPSFATSRDVLKTCVQLFRNPTTVTPHHYQLGFASAFVGAATLVALETSTWETSVHQADRSQADRLRV